MKKIVLVILTLILLSSCSSTYYRTSTDFYKLNRSMSKQQFITWQVNYLNPKDGNYAKGGRPVHTKMFKHENDVWEVWVYEVYAFDGGLFEDLPRLNHYEHIAFKNDLVEEWGTGELPLTIKQNPNQFQYDINVNR
jgi:hypothetical protein